MGAAIFKAAGLLQEQGRDECDNRRGAQQEEQVAKSQDESLLLHDLADGNDGAVGCLGMIDHAVAHEVLGELLDPSASCLFEQGYRLHQHVGMILLALGQKGLQQCDADGAAEIAHHVEQAGGRTGILRLDA